MKRNVIVAVLFMASTALSAQMEWSSEVVRTVREWWTRSTFAFTSPKGNPEQHEFVFARLAYPYCTGVGTHGYKMWDVDFPKADRQLVMGLGRLMVLDAYPRERAVRLGQEEINRYPFIYIVEPAYMCLNDDHIAELREYLEAGGFIFVDDFWGTVEWDMFVTQIRKILPSAPLRKIPLDHPVFHQVYDIEELIQVPNVGQGMQGGPTHEADGYYPEAWGFFDQDDRMLVFIMHNTDLGDAWEWAENPYYPLKYGTYAFKIAANVITYAMSH